MVVFALVPLLYYPWIDTLKKSPGPIEEGFM